MSAVRRAPAILALALALLALPSAASGSGDDVGARIINGSDAPAGAWPSATYLLGTANGVNYWACGGSVIAPRVILTAAHCVMNGVGTAANPGLSRARPGVLLRTDTSTQQAWTAAVPHPDYNRFTFRNDVALITLPADTTAPPMPLIAPWQDGLVAAGAVAAISGWGMTDPADESLPTPARLQQASVPINADAACTASYGADFAADVMLCAGDLAAQIDTCKGDSGGPLALTVGGSRLLVGDTSWGAFPCADGANPGVYGRLSAFRSWLLSGTAPANQLVRDHVAAQTAEATGLTLTNTGSDVTVSWSVTPANWTTTGFRVTINGLTDTTTGPAATRVVRIPSGGPVSVTVEPQVTLGTAMAATVTGTPTPTRPPTVAATLAGTASAGSTLSATASSDDPWGSAPSFQWTLDGAPIANATGSTYVIPMTSAGKRIGVEVRASNAAGTGLATVATGAVTAAPGFARSTILTRGRRAVGAKLSVTAPTVVASPTARITYQWLRNGKALKGKTKRTYVVAKADRGKRLTCRITAKNAVGTNKIVSRPARIPA